MRRKKDSRNFVNLKKVYETDKKISSKIKEYEYDYASVKKKREKNRSEVLKLQRALKRVDERDIDNIENFTMTEVREYEKLAKRQLYDLMQIITQLRKLIENEYTEILYDIRNPLALVEEFFDRLKKFFKKTKVSSVIKTEVLWIVRNIENEFGTLVTDTIAFLRKDIAYLEERKGLKAHLKERGKLKKQIGGKTSWIVSQIERLEDIFKELKEKNEINVKTSGYFIQRISYLGD
tara:strand:+ start:5291 stop:5995 length:705 start_codon:yes stop_codon:yes gene_type:complete